MLVQASNHVRYEVEMLLATAYLLSKGVEPSAVRFALVESFLIHARNLIVFFSQDRPARPQHPQDVWASDYVPRWKDAPGRQKAKELSKDHKDRIDKTIAHLSSARVGEAERDWDIGGISGELLTTWEEFVGLIPSEASLPEFSESLSVVPKERVKAVQHTSTGVVVMYQPGVNPGDWVLLEGDQ